MSAGKGKRVAPEGPLVSTSSSDDDSPRQPPVNSPGSSSSSVISPTPSASTCTSGDHDYDVYKATCSSPSGSSTASGRTYTSRQPDFTTHAHHHADIRRPKNKKKRSTPVGFPSFSETGTPKGKPTTQDQITNKFQVNSDTDSLSVLPTDGSIKSINASGFVSNSVGATSSSGTGTDFLVKGQEIDSRLNYSSLATKCSNNKPSGISQRAKISRGPMPMRQRALPPSFWQQPNVPHNVSPGNICSVFPPLFNKESIDISDVRPVTPPGEQEENEPVGRFFTLRADGDRINPLNQTCPAAISTASHPAPNITPSVIGNRRFSRGGHQLPERTITYANADLLFQLFDSVEKDLSGKAGAQGRKPRSRKLTSSSVMNSSSSVGGAKSNQMLCGRQDPYLVECITEKLFPQLSLESGRNYSSFGTGGSSGGGVYGGHSTLQLLSVREGDRVVTLPSLTNDQNFPAMLTELVAHI